MIGHWLRPAARSVKTGPCSAARTHVGHVRTINEDRVLDAPAQGLWAVADGMGGHTRGDAAAGLVVGALAPLDRPDPATLRRALERADAAVRQKVPGSGATVVALSLDGACAHLAWAGDSRGYRLRDGVLTRLTRDHSVVQELVDAGVLASARAADHPQAHVVTQAIGAADCLAVDSVSVDVAAGDRFLLCSDGLCHRVDDRAIAACLGREPDAAADALVAEALARDGSDNVSVVVIAA